MMRALLLLSTFTLLSCAPDPTRTKVLVGGTLLSAGQQEMPYSVVIVDGGVVTAVGPMATTPIPKGSEIYSTKGRYVTAEKGSTIAVGQPANLVVLDTDRRTPLRHMTAGEWGAKP